MAAAGAEAAAEEEKRLPEGDPESGGDSDDEGDSDSSGDGEDEEKENEAEIQRLEEQVGPAGQRVWRERGIIRVCPGALVSGWEFPCSLRISSNSGYSVILCRGCLESEMKIGIFFNFFFFLGGKRSPSRQLVFIEKSEPAARGFLLPLKKFKQNSLCDGTRGHGRGCVRV